MKILLLNDNPVVNKLVTLSAQKTSDELEIVDSMDVLLPGVYDLLVVDDSLYSDDFFDVIKDKLTFTSSLYICTRDAATVETFSSTIKKPFLPTDLVELFLKFAKQSVSSAPIVEDTADELDEFEALNTPELSEELDLEEDLELDEELNLGEDLDLDELSLEDEDLELSLDDELLLEDDEFLGDEELLLGDEDMEIGESILDDEEAQKVNDLLDETSDDTPKNEFAEYDPQVTANELGLPIEEIEEFLQDFINQANEFKDELYSSLDSRDFDNLHTLSHKIKGVVLNLRMEEALSAIDIVNSSSQSDEVKSSLDEFYKIVAKLADSEKVEAEIATDIDELEEFKSNEPEFDEELELEDGEDLVDELELDDELLLEESDDLELELDETEISTELEEFSNEELESDEELSLTEELEIPQEEAEITADDLAEVNMSSSSEEEEATNLDELEVFSSEELEFEKEDTKEVELDKNESEELIEEIEEELESTEETVSETEDFTEDLELEEEPELENIEEELDLETQIENAVEELSDEDLESELDEETLLEIATSEMGAFDSLNSRDLKLAIGEEVESDEAEIENLEETQPEAQEVENESEDIQTNTIEALENLLAALKDKNVVASMKGMKININITIGEE